MKKELIIAISNRGKQNEDKVEGEFEVPETLAEAVKVVGSEDEVFKLFLAAYKVSLQNSIRKPPARKVIHVLESFKRMLPLIDSGTITIEQARDASQYFGEWPLEGGAGQVA